MKTRIVFHYFLFLAIVLGSFASMAQNDYGLTVVSWACFLFAGIFIYDIIQTIKIIRWDKILELLGLSALAILFGLRALYIYFPYVEVFLGVTCTTLVAIYLLHGIKKAKRAGTENSAIRNLILLYYASLVIFTLSIGIAVIVASLTEILGILAAGLLGLFFLGTYLNRKKLLDGVEINTPQYLRKIVGSSVVLMTGYLLISMYSGLYMIGALPPLYTDEIPHAYIELINDAEIGVEKPVDGVYKHEVYKEAYDNFIEKHQNE